MSRLSCLRGQTKPKVILNGDKAQATVRPLKSICRCLKSCFVCLPFTVNLIPQSLTFLAEGAAPLKSVLKDKTKRLLEW